MTDRPILSVLVPTIPRRFDACYATLISGMLQQAEGKPVEILGLFDNQHRVIGTKRNDLVRSAGGHFCVFVDDDDAVEPDFIDALLDAIANNQSADCISFDWDVTMDGGFSRKVERAVGNPEKKLRSDYWLMPPNHISVWRTELMQSVPFESLNMGEDNAWYDSVMAQIDESARIPRVLYHYRYDRLATETQRPGTRKKNLKDINLSILIPTVPSRLTTFWRDLIRLLLRQVEGKPVEILSLLDNHVKTVGEKRNELLRMSRGRYIAFVDDDDKVADNYVSLLLEAIDSGDGADVIVFDQLLREHRNVVRHKLCRYGLEFENYNDGQKLWTGPPAHTQCWRASIAKRCTFPSFNYTEDSAWVKQAVGLSETQVRISSPPLYYYDYNPKTTETRKAARRNVNRR